MLSKLKPFILSLALTLGVGFLGSLLIPDSRTVYAALQQPPLSPPGWLFPVVWSILYVLIGLAGSLIFRLPASPERDTALRYFLLQLAANFLWPIVFFRLEAYWLALALLLLLLWLTISTWLAFRPLNRTASRLLIPYLLWLLFAAYLNAGVALLN